MAQRDPQPGTARSRQRGKPVQVQPTRNVGFLVGASGLALALVGVVVFAATHQGSGFEDPLARADKQVPGVVVADQATLTRKHVEGAVHYPQNPPNGGDHNATPQVCRVYDAPIPNENAVHSLEHGAVWITYKPGLPAPQVTALTAIATGDPYLMMSPDPTQKDPVDLSAWGRRLSVQSASDPRIGEFIKVYRSGPQTPEQGASCTVGSTATGSGPSDSAPMAPQPAASGAPVAPAPAAPAPTPAR